MKIIKENLFGNLRMISLLRLWAGQRFSENQPLAYNCMLSTLSKKLCFYSLAENKYFLYFKLIDCLQFVLCDPAVERNSEKNCC